MFPLQTITVDVPSCPAVPEQTMFGMPWWGMMLIAAIIIAAIVGTAVVRHRAWESKTTQRSIAADEAVNLAKHAKACNVCCAPYIGENTSDDRR